MSLKIFNLTLRTKISFELTFCRRRSNVKKGTFREEYGQRRRLKKSSVFAMNWESNCSKWPTFKSRYSHSTVRICECSVSTDRFRNPRPYQHANVWRPRWRLKDAAPPSVSASNEHLFDRTHPLVTRYWGAEHHLQWEAKQVNRQRKKRR
jgi:hypothetical protein